ncbi:MAG: molybdopterin-binding protein, partial [Candidatus Bathyarchaeia archaeon]
NVDLSEVAHAVAEVLGLGDDEVMVTDVREDRLILDILRKTVRAEQIFGKKQELLRRLSKIPGVIVTEETTIHSEGILGFIAVDEEMAREVIERSKQMVLEIKSKIAKRAIVFPTGFEIKRGIVKDTNTPLIVERFEKEGYTVSKGDPLEDDEEHIASSILEAISMGYGVIIITGGIGAEDKDKTVEGVLKVDPNAALSYITRYEVGTGRHVKDGVKIAVGKVGETTIITLPGPTEEVNLCLEIVIQGLSRGLSKHELANEIAGVLRKRLSKIAHNSV